ncbi:MAG: HlyD family efflux transporter periplasmic adaptor subunit [Planctomycetota bacterium]
MDQSSSQLETAEPVVEGDGMPSQADEGRARPQREKTVESGVSAPEIGTAAGSGDKGGDDRGREKSTGRMVRLLTRVGVAVGALVLAVVVVGALVQTKPGVELATDAEANLQRVMVVEPRRLAVPRQWVGYGTVAAVVSSDVPARVGATVLEVPKRITEGAVVEAGWTLAELDPTDFANREAAAEAGWEAVGAQLDQLASEEARVKARVAVEEEDVAAARWELERVERLRRGATSAASEKDVVDAQRSLFAAQRQLLTLKEALDGVEPRRKRLQAEQRAAKSEWDQAVKDRERATVKSPIGGVIQAVDVEAGENVMAGSRVARVVQPGVVEVPIRLPGSARGSVGLGDAVELRVAGRGGVGGYSAAVERVSPEDDPETRTFTVWAVRDQSKRGASVLPPGVLVTAVVTSKSAGDRWVLPQRSVQSGRVFRVVDGRAVSVPVEKGYAFEGELEAYGMPEERQWVVLLGELEGEGPVVLTGSVKVQDGAAVVADMVEFVEAEGLSGRAETATDTGEGGGG